MVQYNASHLSDRFAALSDETRRSVLEHLGRGDASISDLAARFGMTLTGIKKHVAILESTGLITTRKVGRTRYCSLGVATLDAEMAWMETYRNKWAQRFDALDSVIEEQMAKELSDGHSRTE